jgi:hypothetical protein
LWFCCSSSSTAPLCRFMLFFFVGAIFIQDLHHHAKQLSEPLSLAGPGHTAATTGDAQRTVEGVRLMRHEEIVKRVSGVLCRRRGCRRRRRCRKTSYELLGMVLDSSRNTLA